MARDKQIIPRYTFPHEEVYINDNSATDLSTTEADSSTLKYLAVFASGKGIDGKLVDINSLNNYYRMFGKTNFAKFGQPHLMPVAYLQDHDNVHCWCLRVSANDSAYANDALSLWYKADVANKVFRIKATSRSIGPEDLTKLNSTDDDDVVANGLHNRDVIIELGSMLDGTAVDGVYVDDEGYTQVPLAVFTAAGRGAYGKNLRWRITQDLDYEKEYGTKFFVFEVLDVEQRVTVVQHTSATLVPNPNFSQTTFVNDVVDDLDDMNRIMNIHVFDENVEALYNAYKNFCDEVLKADPTLDVNIPDLYTFDPFFGRELKKQQSKTPPKQPFIEFAEQSTEAPTPPVTPPSGGGTPGTSTTIAYRTRAVDAGEYTKTPIIKVDSVTGNSLENGSDGAFDTPDATARAAAIDEAYIDAFSGDIDKLILSSRRIPITALYDANYSLPVKVALARLALHRMDCPVYVDTNIRESLGVFDIKTMEADFTELYELIDEYEALEDNWPFSMNAQHYMIKEPSTGRRVTVTSTYYLAASDPEYTRLNSEDMIPRTGEYATLRGHVKNSLFPAIDESDADIKQALTDARINYFEAVGENVFERATDHTYVKNNTDLGVEGNVIALFSFKRILENEFRSRRNKLTTPERRKDFREYLITKYEYLKGHIFDNFNIKYKSNAWEAARSITHVYSEIQFYPRGEITLIEIDVNPKQYREDLEDDEV